MANTRRSSHQHPHAFTGLHAREAEGLVVPSRRSFLKAGWAGLAGLSVPSAAPARREQVRSALDRAPSCL